jgi:D-tyrosyl-tRNA(Tyr) deacylase
MRAVLQRVSECTLRIDGNEFSRIGKGILVLVGIANNDTESDIDWICRKVLNMRIFDDLNGIMNCSVLEEKLEIMLVSQFTLLASTKKGNRPSYIKAANSSISKPIFEKLVETISHLSNMEIKTGQFGADMKIQLTNEGPVTILLDSKNRE